MAVVGVTTAANFLNSVWSNELNRAIEYDTVIASLFDDKSKEAAGGKGGYVFYLVDRHNLTAQTKAEGTDVTPEAITETAQTFTPSTHQIVAQQIEDFAEVMTKYNLRAEFTGASSYALARAQDVAAAAVLDDNTTQTVGDLGSELTDNDLLDSWTYLRNAAAKAPFKGVVAPATWAGLLKVDKFVNSLYNGDSGGKAVHDSQIGKVYQATFHVSQLTTGTAPSSYGNMWAADHYFKIIKKAPTQDTWYSPFAKAWILATDQIFGMFERQEAIETAAATSRSRLWSVRLCAAK